MKQNEMMNGYALGIRESAIEEARQSKESLEPLMWLLLAVNEGRVVVLPCKVGDVVYSPRDKDILEQYVISIEIDKEPKVHVCFACDYICDGCPNNQPYQNQAGDGGCYGENGESYYDFDDFGKTVFLSREEAEQALKGAQHEE